MSELHHIGQRISYNGALCTVRYVGEVEGTTGTWLGVEWDDGTRGKHDGSHKGIRYFACRSKFPTAASLVRPTRPADSPQSFISALKEKYAPEDGLDTSDASYQIKFANKVAEEMGFDKIRRKLAQVKELKVIILDGMRIASARSADEAPVGDTCPSVKHLGMNRNLLSNLESVMDICEELSELRILKMNGNRFNDGIQGDQISRWAKTFAELTELTLEDTLLSWEQLCQVASHCAHLSSFSAGFNQLSVLTNVDFLSLSTTLTTLNLEYNEIKYLSDMGNLTGLRALRTFHLKGNSIVDLAPEGVSIPAFSKSVQYLDVSYNQIESWSFVDNLTKSFPGLTALRIAHNPVYNIKGDDAAAASSEEAHMFTVARMANLTSLNFSQITTDDRMNAEMFYLSRIARQLAAVPESAEASVKSQHPRYSELCETHGEPDVVRREVVNPAFLEARLVAVTFTFKDKERMTRRIPKSLDIYAVKSIAGTLFGVSPLKLRLIWETGEWDPVAVLDDQDESSDDGEERRTAVGGTSRGEAQAANSKGRWIKREVELIDSPRQLGYVVDGLVVTLRVEQVL